MNKTENTLENKAKFFALYWEQDVLFSEKYGKEWVNSYFNPGQSHVDGKIAGLNYHLELTPLSQITDEDLKHLSKISLISSGEYDSTVTDLDLIEFGQYEFLTSERDLKYLMPEAVDFIRLKGYALPWVDLSVEDLVEYGWMKLKS